MWVPLVTEQMQLHINFIALCQRCFIAICRVAVTMQINKWLPYIIRKLGGKYGDFGGHNIIKKILSRSNVQEGSHSLTELHDESVENRQPLKRLSQDTFLQLSHQPFCYAQVRMISDGRIGKKRRGRTLFIVQETFICVFLVSQLKICL